MTIETIKRMLDACYQGKRIRDMLPPLPKGVTSSYIQYLDVIQSLDGWLSAKENLAGRQTHHLHFHHRSGQGALTDV